MKKLIGGTLVLVPLLIASGCGYPTLQQIREMPTAAERRVSKEATCVYSKTKSLAMGKQPAPLFAQLIWQSNWDETERAGEIFALVEGYAKYPIIFKIKDEGPGTSIAVAYDSATHFGRYRDIAMEVFDGADYSRCADKK